MTSAKPAAAADTQRTDSVHITATARAVLALQEAVSGVPDIDTARVERLQQSIDQQHYTVDAGKIADRLMNLEGDLLSAGQTRKY
jgi:flagellar biosynthesis anti-sigma factor FlgM